MSDLAAELALKLEIKQLCERIDAERDRAESLDCCDLEEYYCLQRARRMTKKLRKLQKQLASHGL